MTQTSYPDHADDLAEASTSSGPSSACSLASRASGDASPLSFLSGRKQLVMQTDEGNLFAELPRDINCNANFTQCSDVHVGTKLNINGDVTINASHHIPIPEITEKIECSGNGQLEDKTTKTKVPQDIKSFLKERPTQLWIAGLIMAIMSTVFLIVYFTINFNYTVAPSPPSVGHQDDLGDGIQVIQRKEWLARPPLNVTKLTHPLKIVRIMHTAGTSCSDYQSCQSKVLAMQGWQVGTKGMPDLSYNYMIGGDGNVYVGRGPDVANQYMPNAIDIGYIGNFLTPYDKMTDKMDQAGRRLIAWLRKERYITPDYVVIGQNQTFNTQSPGENIYKRIVKWPHYDSGLYFSSK